LVSWFKNIKKSLIKEDLKKNRKKFPLIIKRIFDILASGIALIVLLPIFAIIGIFIKLDSKRPAFFVQERAGKDGKIFKAYKLKTIVENAVAIGGGKISQNDLRITRVGKHLRWGIDELPQLILTRRTEHHKLARGYLLLQNNLSL
jgi:lipopolysaccharide/colanic/teichoic acid biosynthesis glycosyltransferase